MANDGINKCRHPCECHHKPRPHLYDDVTAMILHLGGRNLSEGQVEAQPRFTFVLSKG